MLCRFKRASSLVSVNFTPIAASCPFKWFRKHPLSANPFWQTLHSYGLAPVCKFMWSFKYCFVVKFFEQTGQTTFSSCFCFTWLVNFVLVGNRLPQTLHVNAHVSGLVCNAAIWLSRVCTVKKILPQISQKYFRRSGSSRWCSMCAFKLGCCMVLPQTGHSHCFACRWTMEVCLISIDFFVQTQSQLVHRNGAIHRKCLVTRCWRTSLFSPHFLPQWWHSIASAWCARRWCFLRLSLSRKKRAIKFWPRAEAT